MKHYLFNDRESGEDFIVGAETLEEAKEIARENFSQPHFIGRISVPKQGKRKQWRLAPTDEVTE